MLSLIRRRGQRIRVGDDIEVVVVNVDGNEIRLGIAAPPEVRVLRPEAHEKAQRHSTPVVSDTAPVVRYRRSRRT